MSTVRRSFDLPVEVTDALVERAATEGVAQVDVVRRALARYLGTGPHRGFLPPPELGEYRADASELDREYNALLGQGRFEAADRLSRGLFRSTGSSEQEPDHSGDGGEVGEDGG